MVWRFHRQIVNTFIRQKNVTSVSCPLLLKNSMPAAFLCICYLLTWRLKDTAAVAYEPARLLIFLLKTVVYFHILFISRMYFLTTYSILQLLLLFFAIILQPFNLLYFTSACF